MNKIDLIIDALEMASHVPRGVMYPAGYHMQIAQALAAARELKDAETKTQQWGNPKHLIEEAMLAEREACAITAWSIGIDLHLKHHDIREVGSACATAIRARGKK
jgi:trehalose utilization protein